MTSTEAPVTLRRTSRGREDAEAEEAEHAPGPAAGEHRPREGTELRQRGRTAPAPQHEAANCTERQDDLLKRFGEHFS